MSTTPHLGSAALVPARLDPSTHELRGYLRLAAAGDDLAGDGATGWPRLLADAAARRHDVSFCSTTRRGATTATLEDQARHVLTHRPQVVLVSIGAYDVRSPSWNSLVFRHRLMAACATLTSEGALLVLVNLPPHAHDPSRVTRANAVLDEVHDHFGGVLLDLAHHPGADDPELWDLTGTSLSRLGHEVLLHEVAGQLGRHGLDIPTY